MPPSMYRKILFALALITAQVFLNIGFAVEETDALNDSGAAIVWFALAAILAAIAILVWEEMLSFKFSVRVIIGICLELFVLLLFYNAAHWASDKAVMASGQKVGEILEHNEMSKLYREWVESQRHPIQIQSSPAALHGPPTSPPEKPDVAIALVYPQEFAALIGNRSSVVLYKAKFGFAMWDLDKLSDQGYPIVLPIVTQEADWIRGHDSVGPEAVISTVSTLIKPGDRLFGWVIVSCPDCLKTRSYWISATVGQGGWFAEMTAHNYPDLTQFNGQLLLQIRQSPDQFFQNIRMEEKTDIYSSLSQIHF